MSYSILIVDDDDDFILLENRIRQCQQDVILSVAVNGVEATGKLMDGLHPNLILVRRQHAPDEWVRVFSLAHEIGFLAAYPHCGLDG